MNMDVQVAADRGLPAPRWLTVMTLIVAIAALLVALAALGDRPATPTAVVPAPFGLTALYEDSAPVTGTGPGLVVVADASRANQGLLDIYRRSAPVTGTGPGLTRIASNP